MNSRRRDPSDGRGREGEADGAAVEGERLDKWLWAARFYKTRALAVDEIDRGRVRVNDLPAKPGRDLKPGDQVTLRQGTVVRTVIVLGLQTRRGPASQAQALYAETDESRLAREAAAQARRLASEPALAQPHGRPTKRDRRQLADWDRWSASWTGADKPDDG